MNYKSAYIFLLFSTGMLYPMEENVFIITQEDITEGKDVYQGEKLEVFSKEYLELLKKLDKGLSNTLAREILEKDGILTFLINKAAKVKTFSSQEKYKRWITIPLLVKTPRASTAYLSSSGTKILTDSSIGMIKGCRPGPVHIFEVGSGGRISTLDGKFFGVEKVTFNKNESKVVVLSNCYKTSSVKVFDVTTGMCLLEEEAGNDIPTNNFDSSIKAFNDMEFTSVGDALILARKKEIELWDIPANSKVRSLKGHTQNVTSVVASEDDTLIISASKDGTAKVWNRKSGNALCTLKPEDGTVHKAQFNEAGDTAYTITDHYLKVWSVEQGTCLHTLDFDTCGIKGPVALNLQGTKLASFEKYDINGAKHLKVWDLEGACLACFEIGKEAVRYSFSRTGEKIFTSTGNGFVRIFDLDLYDAIKKYLSYKVTLHEAVVLKAIYEVVKLRRMVHLREERSQEIKKLLWEEELARDSVSNKTLREWVREKRQKDLNSIVLLKEKKIKEYGITEDGCVATYDSQKIASGELKFDFNTYPHLQPVYNGLPEPIRRALDSFVIKLTNCTIM